MTDCTNCIEIKELASIMGISTTELMCWACLGEWERISTITIPDSPRNKIAVGAVSQFHYSEAAEWKPEYYAAACPCNCHLTAARSCSACVPCNG